MTVYTVRVKCFTRVCNNIIEVKPHPSGWELCPKCERMVRDALARIANPYIKVMEVREMKCHKCNRKKIAIQGGKPVCLKHAVKTTMVIK